MGARSKIMALERNGTVLMLCLGFVFRRLSAFPQQKQQNQQNLSRAMCVMYYGRSCAQNGNRPDVARKQHGNYQSVVRGSCKLLGTYMYVLYIHVGRGVRGEGDKK